MKKEDKDIKKTEEENMKKEQTYQVKTNKKKVIIALICLSAIAILCFLFSTIFAIINLNNTKIISGIKINGIDISNLSKEEAIQKLNIEAKQKLESDILIKTSEFEYDIRLSQIETNYNIGKAVEEAFYTGRDGNVFTNNYDIIKTMILGKEINLEYTYNEELLNKLLNDMNSKIPNPVIEANYCIEDDKLIITAGKSGNSLKIEEIRQKIINEILSGNKNIQIDTQLIEKEPLPIDMDKIYEEVYTEPKDAYYIKDPFQVFPHVDGVDFNLEEAKEILKENKEEYEIQLTITSPEITTNKIGTEAFPDLLSSFSTRYDASNYPRTTNLKLAMNKLDGVVVASGEVFSYNKTLGKRTAAAGYKEAGGYAAGGVVQTLAGGICQISSTLYDAVVYANLDIVERHNHMFLAGYVGAGKDATVVYGALDFKFKNTRKYPILIKTSIGNGVAKIDIYGAKEEVEYDVDIVTNILSYSTYRTVYEEDASLEPGQEKVKQNGMNGCKSITYKVLKLNGVEVSREVLSTDTYDPMNKIIKRGPEKTVETTTETIIETEKTETNKKEESSTAVQKPTQTTKPDTSTSTKPNASSTQKPSSTKPNTGSTQKPSQTKPNIGSDPEGESAESENKEDKTENNYEKEEEVNGGQEHDKDKEQTIINDANE